MEFLASGDLNACVKDTEYLMICLGDDSSNTLATGLWAPLHLSLANSD